MKAIKPKSKSKKNNGRFSRVKFPNKESADTAAPDLSQLRKPIDISVSSLLQVTKLLEAGGDEVKTMLAYECDVVYECRICRSLFRSLVNFISHKRVYCREKFNVSLCRKSRNDHVVIPEDTFITYPELGEDKSKDDDNIRILRSQVVRNSSKKDLTSIVDMLQKKQSEDANENLLESNFSPWIANSIAHHANYKAESNTVGQQLLLESIDTSKTAVYQTATAPIESSTAHTGDLMKAQVIELQNMIGQNTAVLNPEGQSMDPDNLEKSDSPLQIYSSDNDEGASTGKQRPRNLTCSICNAKFATRKTLTYHMKSLHVSYRMCYPCPCCNNTFANTWSVYRHLFKVHRKSNEQVRKLRAQIQEKAFRKETTGAEDIEKENAAMKSSSTTEQQINNDTQEWMEHFELDLELQRCGGCGRRFDRRAALISHSQKCQKRIAACNEAAAANKVKRSGKTALPTANAMDSNNLSPKDIADCVMVQVQSNKKKISQTSDVQSVKSSTNSSDTDCDETNAQVINSTETSIRVENVSRISDADWEMIGNNSIKSQMDEEPLLSADISVEKDQSVTSDEKPSPSTTVPDSPEIIYTSIDESRTVAVTFGSKKRKVSPIDDSKETSNDSDKTENSTESSTSNKKDAGSTDHITIMENRIATIANLRKLQCLPCHRKFTSMTNLRRHMAIHIGWNRYRCKLCDFKCFVKCDCVAHCNKVHDAKNNRAVIADMVIQIPPDQYILAQDIVMDVPNSCETRPEPEIIVVTPSSPKLVDVAEDISNSNDVECLQFKSDEQSRGSVDKSDDEKSNPAQDESSGKLDTVMEDDCKKSKQEDTPHQTISKLDSNPSLRKMVMEVIFGTAETNSAISCDLQISDSISKLEVDSPVKINGIKESVIISENSKIESASTNELKDDRPQRPTRNRVKPVNEDFIYDLTELIRKESAIHRATAIATQKTLKKKQLNQQLAIENGCNKEIKSAEPTAAPLQKLSSTYKLPSILSCKKGESNNYSSKFSLKQAEVKIHSTSGLPSTNGIGSTSISVLSQK